MRIRLESGDDLGVTRLVNDASDTALGIVTESGADYIAHPLGGPHYVCASFQDAQRAIVRHVLAGRRVRL